MSSCCHEGPRQDLGRQCYPGTRYLMAASSSPASSLSRYQQFKDFQRRILVATNLFGRGMDIERVNIVFNYDMPEDSDTYLHRVSAPTEVLPP